MHPITWYPIIVVCLIIITVYLYYLIRKRKATTQQATPKILQNFRQQEYTPVYSTVKPISPHDNTRFNQNQFLSKSQTLPIKGNWSQQLKYNQNSNARIDTNITYQQQTSYLPNHKLQEINPTQWDFQNYSSQKNLEENQQKSNNYQGTQDLNTLEKESENESLNNFKDTHSKEESISNGSQKPQKNALKKEQKLQKQTSKITRKFVEDIEQIEEEPQQPEQNTKTIQKVNESQLRKRQLQRGKSQQQQTRRNGLTLSKDSSEDEEFWDEIIISQMEAESLRDILNKRKSKQNQTQIQNSQQQQQEAESKLNIQKNNPLKKLLNNDKIQREINNFYQPNLQKIHQLQTQTQTAIKQPDIFHSKQVTTSLPTTTIIENNTPPNNVLFSKTDQKLSVPQIQQEINSHNTPKTELKPIINNEKLNSFTTTTNTQIDQNKLDPKPQVNSLFKQVNSHTPQTPIIFEQPKIIQTNQLNNSNDQKPQITPNLFSNTQSTLNIVQTPVTDTKNTNNNFLKQETQPTIFGAKTNEKLDLFTQKINNETNNIEDKKNDKESTENTKKLFNFGQSTETEKPQNQNQPQPPTGGLFGNLPTNLTQGGLFSNLKKDNTETSETQKQQSESKPLFGSVSLFGNINNTPQNTAQFGSFINFPKAIESDDKPQNKLDSLTSGDTTSQPKPTLSTTPTTQGIFSNIVQTENKSNSSLLFGGGNIFNTQQSTQNKSNEEPKLGIFGNLNNFPSTGKSLFSNTGLITNNLIAPTLDSNSSNPPIKPLFGNLFSNIKTTNDKT